MASFYIVITPVLKGKYNLQVLGTQSTVFAFQIGDSGGSDERRLQYRTHNPEVSFCTVNFTNWRPADAEGTAYRHNVRGHANIDDRVLGWYNNRYPPQDGIGKLTEKCIFEPDFGHMPDAKEWFEVTGNAIDFLAENFPDGAQRTFGCLWEFIDLMFSNVDPNGI